MKSALHPDIAPRFWRDPALPFIEARSIADGHKVCYNRHAHEQFSIGCITAGQSTYLSEGEQWRIGTGTVVLMNPGVVHACNPIDDQPWSYRMLYVDTPWLTALQRELGFDAASGFRPFSATHSDDPQLFAELQTLYQVLVDERGDTLHKHNCAVAFFSDLHQRLNPADSLSRDSNEKLERAARYIRQHCTEPLVLEDICQAAQLSASYLTRAFGQRFGMPPHAYLVNQRVQFAQARLRSGASIAEVALEAGFADQAHFQRAFKQHLAATPGQYQQGLR
ncbi:AraC family ligand binding domain-containing protein [Pseudomonas piscis]|uniref:AraC family transcriptional regulator n=1 Tax=Pseudomonas piscis TaxID=2614538 RepID=UPI00384E149C